MPSVVNGDLCIKCKACVEVCPVGAFHEAEKQVVVDPNTCIDCGVCLSECPQDPFNTARSHTLSPSINLHTITITILFITIITFMTRQTTVPFETVAHLRSILTLRHSSMNTASKLPLSYSISLIPKWRRPFGTT